MSIPSRLTGNHFTLHGLIPGYHILYYTGKYMSDMGFSISRGRSVIKSIGRAAFSQFKAFFEDVVVLPELFNRLFTVHKIHVRIYFLKHTSFLLFQTTKRLHPKTGIQPLYY